MAITYGSGGAGYTPKPASPTGDLSKYGYVWKNGKWVKGSAAPASSRPSNNTDGTGRANGYWSAYQKAMTPKSNGDKNKDEDKGKVVTSGSGRTVSGGGSGGSSGSRATTASVPKASWAKDIGTGADIYSGVFAQLAQLSEKYKNLQGQYSYTPQEFKASQANARDLYDARANERALSEANSAVAAYGGQEAAVRAAYAQAAAQAMGEGAKNVAALQNAQSQDIGRMQAYGANAGIGGFGGMANTYGVENDYAQRVADAQAAQVAALNEAAMQQAAGLAGVAGNIAGVRAGIGARAQELGDTAYGQYLQQFNSEQDRAASTWAQTEQGRQAAAQAQLEAALSALSGESANLNATASMLQDWRDYQNQNAWANRNFNYNAYSDELARQMQVDQNSFSNKLASQQAADANYWNKMNYGLSAANNTNDMRASLLNLQALFPGNTAIENYLRNFGLI